MLDPAAAGLLERVLRAFERRGVRALTDAMVYVAVARAGVPLARGDIVAATGINETTVGFASRRLVAVGLATIAADPDDARRRLLQITDLHDNPNGGN